MNFLSNLLYKKYGAWFFLAGSLGFFISASYIDSTLGATFFVTFLVIFLSDPIFFLYETYIKKENTQKGLWLPYLLGLGALLAYWTRQWIEISITDLVAGEEALLPRLRLLLLFLYLIAYIAALLSRLMIALSEGRHETSSSRKTHRHTRLKNALLSILTVLSVLVLLNYLSSVRNPVLDFSGRLTFSTRSTPLIRSIKEEVRVYAFLPEAQNVKTRGRTGTRELSRIADEMHIMLEQLPILNSQIKLEFLNADLAAYESNEFGNVNNGTIIVRKYKPELRDKDEKPYIERRIYVYTKRDMKKLERELTRALAYVSAPKTTACFPVSNGERFNQSPESTGMEILKEQLRFFNTSLRPLDHTHNWPSSVPEECDMLFLTGPTIPYGKEARTAIIDFIQKGGSALIAIRPSSKEKFSWLLQKTAEPSYEAQSEILFNTRLPAVALTDSTASHRITDTLVGAKRPPIVLLNHSWFEKRSTKQAPNRANNEKSEPNKHPKKHLDSQDQKEKKIKKNSKQDKKTHPVFRALTDLRATEIVFSLHQSFVDRNHNGLPDKNEQIGRKALALAYAQPDNPDSPRIVFFSGVDFLSDQAINFPIQSSNLQLLSDSLHWMTESPLIGEAIPEDPAVPTVQLTDSVKLRLLILGVLVFPLFMGGGLALAIAIYRKRRRFINTGHPQKWE